MIEVDPKARAAETERKKQEAFTTWLASPTTKMMLSLIPASDQHPEAVQLLLQTAFDAGHTTGAGEVAATMIEAVLRGWEKKERGG